jgi:hypothetical protein
MTTKHLIQLAEAYSKHRDLTLSTVSTYAANDGKWIPGLVSGAGCTFRKAEVVLGWFSDNWPDELEWPRAIPRPRKRKDAA